MNSLCVMYKYEKAHILITVRPMRRGVENDRTNSGWNRSNSWYFAHSNDVCDVCDCLYVLGVPMKKQIKCYDCPVYNARFIGSTRIVSCTGCEKLKPKEEKKSDV